MSLCMLLHGDSLTLYDNGNACMHSEYRLVLVKCLVWWLFPAYTDMLRKGKTTTHISVSRAFTDETKLCSTTGSKFIV